MAHLKNVTNNLFNHVQTGLGIKWPTMVDMP